MKKAPKKITDIKTTERHLKVFKEAVNHFLKELNLSDWKVYCDRSDRKDAYGACTYDMEHHVAIISLASSWYALRPLNDDELRKVAFHECCHLLLGELTDLAKERFSISEQSIDASEHSIICRLENCFLKFKTQTK